MGKTWEIFAVTPTINDTIPLIRINDWNFDWQFWYSPEYMIHLPQGTVVHVSCIYDNTSDNPITSVKFLGDQVLCQKCGEGLTAQGEALAEMAMEDQAIEDMEKNEELDDDNNLPF